MSNLIFSLLIIFSFFLIYFFNLKIKNFDKPGKNKVQKVKVLTSAGLFPFIILTLILFYYIYFSNAVHSEYFYSVPQKWLAPTCISIFVLISFYDLNFVIQARLFLQLILVYLSFYFCQLIKINFQHPYLMGLYH